MYSVVITRKARKDLKALSREMASRITKKLREVARDPYGPNNNVKALADHIGYSLRVGQYRAIYYIEGTALTLFLLRAGHRKEVYKMSLPYIDEVNEPSVAYVRIPASEYEALLDIKEETEDLQAIREAKRQVAAGETLIPLDVFERILQDEHPVKVYREYRGFTQAELAEASGVNRVFISEIERGKKQGSLATMNALAAALQVYLDDLV